MLQGLDKITARVSQFDAPVGQTVRFGDAVDPGARLREERARRPAGKRRLCPDRRDPAGRDSNAGCSAAGCSRRARRCRRSNTRSTTSTCSTANRAPAAAAARHDSAAASGAESAKSRENRRDSAAPRRAAGDSGRGISRSRRIAPDAASRTGCRAGGSRRAAGSATRCTSATLLASVTRLNMLSPKNARAERDAVKPADQRAVHASIRRCAPRRGRTAPCRAARSRR